MAYIGSEPNYGTVASQRFTGDGSTTSFGLTQTVPDGESIIVTIGNVVQEPGASAAYTASGNTLAFSAAPANGDVIMVRYLGRSIDTPSSYTNVIRFKYVATASQTVFTGADINSAILAFSWLCCRCVFKRCASGRNRLYYQQRRHGYFSHWRYTE